MVPRNRVTFDKPHPPTPTNNKLNQAQTVLRLLQCNWTPCLNFCARSCLFKSWTLQRPSVDILNTHRKENGLHEHAWECAYLASRPRTPKLNWPCYNSNRHLWFPSQMYSLSTVTRREEKIKLVSVKVLKRNSVWLRYNTKRVSLDSMISVAATTLSKKIRVHNTYRPRLFTLNYQPHW